MLSKFVHNNQFELVKIFDEVKAKNLVVIGKFVRVADGKEVVLKIQTRSDAIAELEYEAGMNQSLDPTAPETTRMIDFVPAQPGMGDLVFKSGKVVNQYAYMVVPLQGLSLLDLINSAIHKKRHLSWGLKQYLCSEVIHCVHYLHSDRGMAHLDLKPDNLVLTALNRLSLIDFGMAELLGKVVKVPGRPNKMTPMHRAYEVWSQDSFEAAPVDVWGVGVVLFTVMCQSYPFAKGCKKDTEYAQYFSGLTLDRMGFFQAFESLIQAAPSKIPFHVILSCFQRDPQLRPSMEYLAGIPFFQRRPLSPEEEAELIQLLV